MFYEELRDIEVTEYITERDIKKLDEWLVRTPMRNRKNLKSDSFAEAEGVEKGKALGIFLEAYKVNVLGVRFQVIDSKRNVLGEYSELKEVPKVIYNKENKKVEVNGDNTLILFSLKARSTQVPSVKKGIFGIIKETE